LAFKGVLLHAQIATEASVHKEEHLHSTEERAKLKNMQSDLLSNHFIKKVTKN